MLCVYIQYLYHPMCVCPYIHVTDLSACMPIIKTNHSTTNKIWPGPKKMIFKELSFHPYDRILNYQGRGHMMDTMMARGGAHWGGSRYGGDSGYQDDGHSAFLELRASANPQHAQHRPLDRRASGHGQHFPLSARWLFGCFTWIGKISGESDQLWAEVLHQARQVRIWKAEHFLPGLSQLL